MILGWYLRGHTHGGTRVGFLGRPCAGRLRLEKRKLSLVCWNFNVNDDVELKTKCLKKQFIYFERATAGGFWVTRKLRPVAIRDSRYRGFRRGLQVVRARTEF